MITGTTKSKVSGPIANPSPVRARCYEALQAAYLVVGSLVAVLQQLDEQRDTSDSANDIGMGIVGLNRVADVLLPALHVETPAQIKKTAALMRAAEELLAKGAG